MGVVLRGEIGNLGNLITALGELFNNNSMNKVKVALVQSLAFSNTLCIARKAEEAKPKLMSPLGHQNCLEKENPGRGVRVLECQSSPITVCMTISQEHFEVI